MRISTLAFVLPFVPSLALASGLDDYKTQKHTDRPRVTADTCEEAYLEQHGLDPEDPADQAKAATFCEERARRKTRKTVELVAKGASVGAGAAAVAAENAVTAAATRRAVSRSGQQRSAGPDTLAARRPNPWLEKPDAVFELGGGLISDVGAGTAVARGRVMPSVGLGATTTLLADSDDWLNETDLGPILYLDSRHIEFGLQPSLLVSAGNDVSTEFGAGVRSYTTVDLGRLSLHLDPMLGRINRQWVYHLRPGVSYRFTPAVYARVSYDYRDVLDMGDLDISQASMQGVMGTVGFRF